MKTLRLCTVVSLLMFSACEHESPSSANPPIDNLLYSRDIAPIFNNNCALSGCHDLTTRQVGLALNSWENIIRGSLFGEVVIAFAPEKSLLVDMITGRGSPRMPFGRPPLDSLDLARIAAWIRQGANDDNGIIPFDDDKPRLYVAHEQGGLVSILDVEGLQVARVVLSGDPALTNGLSIFAGENFWYVSNRQQRRLMKFEERTNRLLGLIGLPFATGSTVLSNDGGKAYVGAADSTSGASARIILVNTANMTLSKEIATHRGPHSLAIAASGQRLFVAHRQADWVTVINTQNDNVTLEFPLEAGRDPQAAARHQPSSLALSPDENELWVSCSGSNQLRIYSTSTGAFIDSVMTLAAPQQIAMTASGRKLYVPCRGAERILVVDAQTRTISKNISGHDVAQPVGCVISPDGKYVFVTSTNELATYRARRVAAERGNVVVIDMARDQITKIIEVQELPLAISASR